VSQNLKAYQKLNLKGLENKYVIVVNGKLVAKGDDIEEMLRKVRQKYPKNIPFVAKVPSNNMMVVV